MVTRSSGGPETVALHRVTADWTEGADDADGNEGAGTAATSGATWLFRDYNTTAWMTAGGDFDAGVVSSAAVAGNVGSEVVLSDLHVDVQRFLANPTTSFGWLLKHQSEATVSTAKRWV